ncbi:MAG: penicillin-binding protein 1A [Leptolyngbyaceae bacterium]|nr:penicillin-binding protein 1A [Leptolyngbyaceae bacterium]
MTPHQDIPTAKPQEGKKAWYRSPVFQISILFLGGSAAAISWGFWTIESTLPDTAVVATFVRDGTITVKASNGRILQQVGPATRDKLPIAKIPDTLVQAFLAAEDRRFYKHTGVDYQGIGRAIFSNLTAGGLVEGGSTLTQQLARMVFLTQERSLLRKVREALLAQKIERDMTKSQILERYLNLVYLGSGAYGIADAAWVYFSKQVYELTLSEIATIAGLPPAPSSYSPLVDLDTARQRRNIVLRRMQNEGFITAEQADGAIATPLTIKPSAPKRLAIEAPYFTAYIQQELPKHVSPEALEVGGLIVETTLNTEWQKFAEAAIKDAIELDGPGQGFEQAALVAINPRDGEIKAMVGGKEYKSSKFNRATQAQRQPGSTFKAFVYATAIAAGFSPYDAYLDAPYKIDGYEPRNASRRHYGWLSMRDALTNSVNVIAIKVLVAVGFEPVIQLAHQMGIKSELKPTYSLALGASEVNLLELTSAYGTLAAQGKHIESHGIRRILNRKGEVLYDADFKSKQVLDKDSASIVTWMLESVVNSGTGSAAQLDRQVAGKTGTTENARDLWFMGYIPQVVAGVWLGNDNNDPTWGASSTAAYTWGQFMKKVVEGMAVEKFPDLPTLEGRKGTIKAQPITPGRVLSGNEVPVSEDDRNRYYEDELREPQNNPEPSPPNRGSEPVPTVPNEPSSPPENSAPPPRSEPTAPVPADPPVPAADPPPEPAVVTPENVAPAVVQPNPVVPPPDQPAQSETTRP